MAAPQQYSPKDKRQSSVQESLTAPASVWINELPQAVRPVETGTRFPRVVNQLCRAWDKPQQCNALFEDLLLDRRGDRQGFPREVAFELAALKNYYETAVHPSQQTVWDDIIRRARER